MTNGSLIKVQSIAECSPWSILQYFWPLLSHNRPWKPIFLSFWKWPFYTDFTVWAIPYFVCMFVFCVNVSPAAMVIIWSRGPHSFVFNMLVYYRFCWNVNWKSGTASVKTHSQWSKQEACFAHVTQVWLPVNHNTNVMSAKWIQCLKCIVQASELGSYQS